VDIESLGLKFAHADYVIDCVDVVVVVEETEKSKLNDADALENTVEWVLSNKPVTARPRIYAVVHHHGAADPYMPKALMSRMRSARRRGRDVIYWCTRCRSIAELVKRINSEFNLSITL
jgi:hypothetical protein